MRSNCISHGRRVVHGVKWQRPNVGFFKCNCDAAIFDRERYTSMGCVLCNSHNGFLGCFVTKMYGVMSMKEA